MKPINLVALIDDDEIVQFIESAVIKSTELVEKIKTFSNGEDAFNFLKANSNNPDLLPEIILLDLNMPIMDGFEFLEKYIVLSPKLGKKITIYVVSSSISQADIERVNQISEVSDYIIKPITKEKFIKIVSLLIENPSSDKLKVL
ncbi:MAG: response regulator [Bacteroidota bacterium]|nr:response regulator [Bacteroidota bacterium]MDP3145427.1 response regulator [Bacteroidota bacterium]MDP3557204.1 response regulator [Bacteroidota bacterium]